MKIKVSEVNPQKLPSLPLVERSQLPKIPAIYFVLEGQTIIYIGQSINLVGRFKNHNRLKQFKELKDIRISWLEFHNSEVELLLEIEKLLINHFKPTLNGSNCPNTSKRIFATLPDSIFDELEFWAKEQGRPTANFTAFLIEASIKQAKKTGEFPEKEYLKFKESRKINNENQR